MIIQPAKNKKTVEQTVYIVDDDHEICEALSWLLASASIRCVTYTCGLQFLEEYQDEPGCIILDVRMKNISGLRLQEELLKRNQHIPIILITGHGDVKMAVRAMKNGAVDFLTKPFNSQDLLEIVQSVLNNNSKTQRRNQEKSALREKVDRLTAREKDILHHLMRGKATKAIAKEFDISVHTVELHRANLTKKMNVASVSEIVRLVILYDVLDYNDQIA